MSARRGLLSRLNTIRTKIILLPLVLLAVAITALAGATVYFIRMNMLREMEQANFQLAEQVVERVADNNQALAVIHEALEDKILTVGRMVITNKWSITSAYLTQLALDSKVDAIHWYNRDMVITDSAFREYLGWQAPPDHPVAQFATSGMFYMIEDIRKDSESDNYYIYGYVRGTEGEFVQVGILADTVMALTERFSPQTLMEELAAGEQIVYALVVDKDLVITAHSDGEQVGIPWHGGEALAAAAGERLAREAFYEAEGVDVYEVSMPIMLDGEQVGTLVLGLSMAGVQAALRQTLFGVMIIGGAAFIVLGGILRSMSLGIVRGLRENQSHLRKMAEGDFTETVATEFLNRGDELGDMARAVHYTQASMKNILDNVARAALEIASTSQQLSANTEETSASIEEVAGTSNEFASTVQQLTDSSQAMVKEANQILDATSRGSTEVERAVASSEELREVIRRMAGTVDSLGKQSQRIGEIVEVITDIAEQTNLLALNAAIEAARAGEHGLGFAVVADEVRKLAEQSANFTASIIEVIKDMQGETGRTIVGINHGVKRAEENTRIVQETGSLIHEIIDSINSIIAKIGEFSEGLGQINFGSHEIAATAEEQSASIDAIAASAQNLSNMAERLQELVSKFKLKQ
jgi:methyl-accepting chemotaxis protein